MIYICMIIHGLDRRICATATVGFFGSGNCFGGAELWQMGRKSPWSRANGNCMSTRGALATDNFGLGNMNGFEATCNYRKTFAETSTGGFAMFTLESGRMLYELEVC